MKRSIVLAGLAATLALGACESPEPPTAPLSAEPAAAASGAVIGINVLLNRPATAEILADLGRYGAVVDRIDAIHAVFMQGDRRKIAAIAARPYVAAAGPDAERYAAPIDPIQVEDFAGGLNTWDLDAVNVTDFGTGRTVSYDGSGIYVGVLDTGLLDTWRQYFPEERIAVDLARSFTGGGALDRGAVAQQPNKWEHDTNSHGTHVTSTILGYSLRGAAINGVAPRATVIPVKVLHSGELGFGWSSMIAKGITYIGELKAGPLAAHPVVINMSLGGPALDPVEKAAIDFAIAQGVIIVAAAGNSGEAGMGFPGAYEPVISVAASGWVGEWIGSRAWWLIEDVPDPTDPADFYITDFSSRAKAGQDLDVAAPGSWVVGPFQLQMGSTSYFFLGGTSMASPHVAGIVALMAQKNPALGAEQAENILQSTALTLPAGCRTITGPSGAQEEVCWGADATGHGLVDAVAALSGTP